MTQQKKTKKQQKVILPILLWLVPLIALNSGFYFLNGIDLRWRQLEQDNKANQEIQALADGSQFSYQFSKVSGQYRDFLKSSFSSGLSKEQLKIFLKKKAKSIFAQPFPRKDLFVFKIASAKDRAELVLLDSERNIFGKRAFCRVFKYLVNLDQGKDMPDVIARQNEKLLTSLMGPESSGEMMAGTQRAKTSYAFYNDQPHWFIWDYFEIENQGTYGYMVLSPCLDKNRFDGMKLALKDFQKRQIGLGGFIPLFKGYGQAVLQEPLKRSALYQNWLEEKVVPVEKNLQHWLTSGTPPTTQLGNFRLFSYLGKGNTHLTTLLLPALKHKPMPVWLYVLNILVFSLVGLLLLRGFLFDQWPRLKLKLRFQIIFLLAATLPLSLLLIASSGYLSQYRRAIHFQTVSKLLMCIKQYDSRKAQISDEYRTTFSNLISDPELARLLKKFGPKNEEVKKFILKKFEERENPLPIMCFTVLDNGGTGLKWYRKNKEKELKTFIDSFIYPVVGFLRRRIEKADPDFKLKKLATSEHEALAAQAYYSVTSNDLIEQVGRRRSFPIVRQRGKDTATQMHDYIKVDGIEKYAILVVWEESDINVRSLRQTTDFLALNNPEFNFLQFRSRPQGFELINENTRHLGPESIKMAENFAETAYFRGSSLSSRTDKYSLVAYPAKRYVDTVIIGIADNYSLNKSIDNRVFIFVLIVIVAILIVMLAAYLSANLILNPITRLKSSIDQVAEGNLDTQISAANKDELGQLAVEFTGMANGLKERKELASLISDHAIEALSQNQEADGVLSSQSFSGIALVSDIRNFTGLCEKHEPDKITELLNEHFARMATIISQNGGRIYKFIGDAIEAVFPEDDISKEENALRAFKTASLMNIELHKINNKRGKAGLFHYNFGVGLSIGKFYSGGVGSLETRLDYAVVGEPLKYAADLESQSTRNPQFPIVVDKRLSDLLASKGVTFSTIEDSTGYFINEIVNQELIAENDETGIKSEENTVTVSDNINDEQQLILGKSWLFSIFIFIILTLGGIYYGLKFTNSVDLNSSQIKLKEKNLRLIEQLKCENVERVGIETKCNQIVDQIESQINFTQKSNEKDILIAGLKNSIEPLQKQGLPVKRIALLHFDNFNLEKHQKNPLDGNFIKTIQRKGWNSEQLSLLKTFAHYKLNYDYGLQREGLREPLNDAISRLLGNKHTISTLYSENFGTAIDATIDENQEIFYSSYIYKLKDELKNIDFSKNVSKLKMSSQAGLFRIAGILLISVDRKLSQKPGVIAELYATNDCSIALTSSDSKIFSSANFGLKPGINNQAFTSGFIKMPETGVLNEDTAKVANKTYRISIFSKFNKNSFTSLESYKTVIGLVFILITILFYRTVNGSCFINRYLSTKLWLAFLICSIIPICTVYIVVELFETENLNARISQERSSMQSFLDLFENRQTFAEPLAWKKIKQWAFSGKLKKAVEEVDQQPSKQKDFAPLDKAFADWHQEMNELRKTVSNFQPRDTALVSKQGWEYVNAGSNRGNFDIDKEEPDDKNEKQFAMLLAKIGKNLILRMRREESSRGFDGESLKGEISLDVGLGTVKAMFGNDVAIKLANGVGLPVKMGMLDAIVGIIIHPVEQILMPDFIMINMTLFSNGGYLEQIASLFEGKYAIFPKESNHYGVLGNPTRNLFDLGLNDISNWVLSSNLPLSGTINFWKNNFIFESKKGTHQANLVITGIKPLQPIVESVNNTTNRFLIALGLSLLLIILLARNISEEIIDPIRKLSLGMKQISKDNFAFRIDSIRNDELGELCASFNQMARGLEEKELMGKMISKKARIATKDSVSSRKEEAVVLYVGSPGFNSWLSLSSPSELFSDLQKQISDISRIIIEEGGDIDKIIGDKVLAVFRGESNKAPAAACKAAARILNEEKLGHLPFPVAAGINKGQVIAGILGVGNKKDFTIIGDVVNVAARIEGLAENMRFQRVLISQNVYDLANDFITAREHGAVELKGKSEKLKVFQLENN